MLHAKFRGSVVLIGESLDAYMTMRRLLATATSDALLVEPDAAAKILADYAILAPERVRLYWALAISLRGRDSSTSVACWTGRSAGLMPSQHLQFAGQLARSAKAHREFASQCVVESVRSPFCLQASEASV